MSIKNIIRNIGFFLLIFSLGACQEETLTEYQNDPRLSFGAEQDTLVVASFFVIKTGIDLDTVFLQVETLGDTVGFDRPFSVEQIDTEAEYAAVPGIHYVGFDEPEIKAELFIPAGAVKAAVPVIVKRDKSLQTAIYELRLKIQGNEYFKPGLLNHTTCVVRISDKGDKPVMWDSFWKASFGEWCSVKMKFIIDYVGLTDFEDYPSDPSYGNYLKAKAQQQLSAYKANPMNPPLYDETKLPEEIWISF